MKKQIDITFDKPEPFALKVQQTKDGDRITREAQQRQADKAESEKHQQPLIP